MNNQIIDCTLLTLDELNEVNYSILDMFLILGGISRTIIWRNVGKNEIPILLGRGWSDVYNVFQKLLIRFDFVNKDELHRMEIGEDEFTYILMFNSSSLEKKFYAEDDFGYIKSMMIIEKIDFKSQRIILRDSQIKG